MENEFKIRKIERIKKCINCPFKIRLSSHEDNCLELSKERYCKCIYLKTMLSTDIFWSGEDILKHLTCYIDKEDLCMLSDYIKVDKKEDNREVVRTVPKIKIGKN